MEDEESIALDALDAIIPETEPVSPSLVDFSKQSVTNLKTYTSIGRKDINPSAISTMYNFYFDSEQPSTSFSSRTGKERYKQMNGMSEINFAEQSNVQNVQFNHSKEQLTGENKDSSSEKIQTWCKCLLVVTVLLAGIAGVIVVIITNDDVKHPNAQKQGQPQSTGMCNITIPETIKYKEQVPVNFNCTFDKVVHEVVTKMKVAFDPKFLYSNERMERSLTLNGTDFVIRNAEWTIKCNFTNTRIILKCEFLREPVNCDSGGRLTVALYRNESRASKMIEKDAEFDVEGDVSHVDLKLNQTLGERSNSSVVDITCSARSSCTTTSLWLFSQRDGEIQRRFDINFTCIIEYNVAEGTNIECTGAIPGTMLKSFGTVLCRSDLNGSGEAKSKPPICVGDECTFDCPDEGADIYYSDPLDCKVVHRCAERRLYSGPCANATYFNPQTCACDHVDKVTGCDSNGERIKELNTTRCGARNE